jgi:nuclear pore complex protein Nup133
MFSPAVTEATGPAKATRSNNRRRQRPLSSDSLAQQPKAKRQRLPLTETTFINPENGLTAESLEVKQPASNGHNRGFGQEVDGVENFGATPAQPRRELSLRSKKAKAGERVNKGDGSIVLVSEEMG